MAEMMVVNVDTWGSGGNSLSKGDVVPSDTPGDLEWAKENKVIVTADEYRMEHPEWRPPGAKDADDPDAKAHPDAGAQAPAAGNVSRREANATGTSPDRSGKS